MASQDNLAIVPDMSAAQVAQANPAQVDSMPHARRAVNSWMAFRTYYAPIFANIPQKEVSTYLTTLWQSDPFKAKWAILAKAYSTIRDYRGREQAPLQKFLDLVCPMTGIVDVNEYLNKMNWTVAMNDDGVLELAQNDVPDLNSFESVLVQTDMTDLDIIRQCIQQGYIPGAREFIQVVETSTERMMTQSQLFNPTEDMVRFHQTIKAHPRAVAAHLLGLDINHDFFKLSTERAPITKFWGPYVVDGDDGVRTDYDDMVGPEPVREHEWTGSMSELYNPDEEAIDLEQLFVGVETGNTDYLVTNISNPAELDATLITVGYGEDFVFQDFEDDILGPYTISDSF